MTLKPGDTLYHGSYIAVDSIDLSKCQAGKDFGQGFYLTDSPEQAKDFIKTSILKAKNTGLISQDQNFGYVSKFKFQPSIDTLIIEEFPTADASWLTFVSVNRRKNLAGELSQRYPIRLANADIIIGKIANDTTNKVISAYLNGIYGPPEQEKSINMALSLLLPNRLKEQYCFLTNNAVAALVPNGTVKYEL